MLRRSSRTRPFRPLVESLEARDVPAFYGNQVFPLDNPWNQVISSAPVAANSDAIISRIVNRHHDAAGNVVAPRLHPDFGNPTTDGALYGIPVNVVDSAVPKVNVVIPSFGYPGESDLVPVPIPAGAVIEGDGPTGPNPPSQRGDSHLLVYDKTANVLYELYQAVRPSETSFPYGGTHPTGQWGAYQVSYWDLNTNSFRTVGATSADAAGLPITPGLVRPDETLPASAGGQGVITHAIRMTVQQTADAFVYPASHEASSLSGSDLPRMGERFRLKSSFVIPSTWSPEAKAIARAMKDYGMIVADNGSDMFFTGTPSDQWNMDSVLQVQSIRATDFEVVDLAPRVSGLGVTSGPTGGGTAVTVSGKNFSGAAGQLHVLFGGVEAASVAILSDTQVVAVAPAHAAGAVDVRVKSGADRTDTDGASVFFGYGTSAVTPADQFTFSSTSPPAPPPPPGPPPPPPPTSPPPPPPAGTGDGLRGTYFSNADFTGTSFRRIDSTVNFDWGLGSPSPALAPNTFSVRWKGKVQAVESGTYTFRTYSDEGVRVWVNGQLIIDHWTAHAAAYDTGTIALVAGQKYDIKVEYFEGRGNAAMKLEWKRPGKTAFVAVPQSRLYSAV